MGLFTRDSIERLRDAIDMVDLVSAKTDLRRVGSRFTGLCPFHDERTPSFSVNADEKLFYCFGCQALPMRSSRRHPGKWPAARPAAFAAVARGALLRHLPVGLPRGGSGP